MAKPGIVYGNITTTAASFVFASTLYDRFDLALFAAVMTGTALVIACGCVINNYIDRHIDALMARTSQRPLAAGKLSGRQVIPYGVFLGIVGFTILIAYTNWLTAAVGASGLFFYLVMYSIFKRRSWLGTIVGSVSGATPIVAGYTAASGRLDAAAITLFLIMAFWQIPHFYAIAIFRIKEYKAASLPVLSVSKGVASTKLQMLIFMAAFIIATTMLTILGYTGYSYLVVTLMAGLYWLYRGLSTYTGPEDHKWGLVMFLTSLKVLMVLSVMVALGAVLP